MASTSRVNILNKIYRYRTEIVGSLFIGMWTMIRFFNSPLNFDQVGQQVIAHQWLNGLHSGSVIGPTNYILKIIFIYMPLNYLELPAEFKIILSTIIVNIATFVLLLMVLRRIFNELHPETNVNFDAPAIYLSLISGSVFWISFINSRNLEVVGGVLILLLCLKLQSKPKQRNYLLLLCIGSLTFFADPLQIYMSLLPALIFCAIREIYFRKTKELKNLWLILSCGVSAILIARLLSLLVENIWSVSFIHDVHAIHISLQSFKETVSQLARLYAGGYEGGRLREAVDLIVLAGTLLSGLYVAVHRPKSRQLLSMICVIWLTNIFIYIASGQALQPNTNRYLIMTVPAFILLLAVVLQDLPNLKLKNNLVFIVIFINAISLTQALINNWNPHFNKNAHYYSSISYLKSHNYSYGYASIGTALSSDYLSNFGVNVLPVGCETNYSLKKTNLFFDKASFNINNLKSESLTPIILDGNIIKINKTACDAQHIQLQLGPPHTVGHLSDGSMVLLYSVEHLRSLK